MSIECRYISKSFKNRKLFYDLNAVFPSGVCNCIMGENGTGKTTLLKIIAGLEKQDSGVVEMTGSCTYAGSNPYMMRGTVLENIKYPLTLKRQSGRCGEECVDEMIDRLGLKELKYQEARTLSAGEKQKVALGRAMVWNPDILLLDEPTANIDRKMIENIEKILLEYASNPSHTLVVVSHSLKQVGRLSGNLWLLQQQRLNRSETY